MWLHPDPENAGNPDIFRTRKLDKAHPGKYLEYQDGAAEEG